MLSKENIALYAFQRYGDTALQAAYCSLGNRADAEDVAQDVFFALHRAPQDFNDDEHLKAWILRAVMNRCKNMHKSIWRRMRAALEDIPTARQTTDDDRGLREILQLITELPQPYSEVVFLHDYEGYSIREIAEMLDRPEPTLRSQLRRGHQKLQIELTRPAREVQL